MSEGPLKRILRENQAGDLLEILAERLSPSDLQSLLLEVYRKRAAGQAPARLLGQYENNRFTRPSASDPRVLLEFDRLAFALAAPLYEPLELAPVCPLGAVSALGPVDQNSTVATIRNTEVVSDSTNVLALECAARRAQLRSDEQKREWVRLCASHRLLRGQNFDRPGMLAHFRMFALVASGRDEGSHRFEFTALVEQVGFYLRLLLALNEVGYTLSGFHAAVTDFSGTIPEDLLRSQVIDPLKAQFAGAPQPVQIDIDAERSAGRGYYPELCFNILAADQEGVEHSLGDGGFVPWTQILLSNRKERLLISGMGTERVCSLFGPGGSLTGSGR